MHMHEGGELPQPGKWIQAPHRATYCNLLADPLTAAIKSDTFMAEEEDSYVTHI